MAEINLLHVNSLEMGYGRYGTMLAAELENLGIEVYDDLEETIPKRSAKFHTGLREQKICNVTCWVSTPAHCYGYWKGQYPVLASMWETMHLPEEFRANLEEFELVIVPSLQNVELFSEHHRNVKFVPLGVDPQRWHYRKRQDPHRFFNFLIAGSGTRKGTDLAHQAFRKLWPNERSWGMGPIPRLIMKSPRGEDYYGPRVEIVTGKLSNEDEVELYADAHCYLQPSRGEGFGLQPLQAMAQGCPTVLTDAHGHKSFAHLGWGLSSEPSKASYFVYGEAGDWWEPSLDDLCDHMRWIYDNYGAACERAEQAASVVATEFTWRRTAERFVEAIGRERLDPCAGPREWHTLEQKRFMVVTNRDFTANAVGATYRFRQGKEYWETAGVKRLLFEAGILEARCLNEGGLAREQVERLSAAHEYCDSCGQRLNSQPTKADDILRGT